MYNILNDNEEIVMTIGEIIKEYRKKYTITMDDFAQMSGLSKGYISMLEKNENPRTKLPIMPTTKTLQAVSAVLNISIGELMDKLGDKAEIKNVISAESFALVPALGNYLDHAALFTNMDQTEKAQAVKLMTIHAAKGLEFPVVFLCGLSEGIFPGKRANTREKLEEERRLCYVAFTRARDRLFLSDAAGTNYDGSFRYPSRFLFNAEKENLDYCVPLDPGLVEEAMEKIRKTEDYTPRTEKQDALTGKRVRHPVFGEGVVIGIPRGQEGVIIQFDAMVTPRTFGAAAKLEYLA